MGDILNSIKEAASNRLSHPASAAFIISWCVVNYQLLMILASDGDYKSKIWYIESILYRDGYLTPMLYHPAIGAFIYVAILPLPKILADAITDYWDGFSKRLLNHSRKYNIVTKEDRNRLLDEISNINDSYRQIINDYDQKVKMRQEEARRSKDRYTDLLNSHVFSGAKNYVASTPIDQRIALKNYTYLETQAQAFLSKSGLPKKWAEAMWSIQRNSRFNRRTFEEIVFINKKEPVEHLCLDWLVSMNLVKEDLLMEDAPYMCNDALIMANDEYFRAATEQ